MSEPEKAACYLTNRGDYGESHLAQLYLKASLHAVDSYFNQVRTRLSPLQRAVHSPSSARRTWYGKQPYDPRIVQKLLDLLRLFHNYCLKSKKRQDDTGHASWTGTCPDRSGRGDLLSAVTTEGLPKNEEAFAFLPHVK